MGLLLEGVLEGTSTGATGLLEGVAEEVGTAEGVDEVTASTPWGVEV